MGLDRKEVLAKVLRICRIVSFVNMNEWNIIFINITIHMDGLDNNY